MKGFTGLGITHFTFVIPALPRHSCEGRNPGTQRGARKAPLAHCLNQDL